MSAQPETPGTARRCAFCGRPADSREHILPRWLANVLPSDEPAVHSRLIGSDRSQRKQWTRHPFKETTRIVCRDFNGGWMSRLESRAKPLLAPPIAKTPTLFDQDGQRVAAAWALRACLVLQASLGSRVTPSAHYAYLRAHEKPPPQITVWLASHYRAKQDPMNSIYVQRPLSLAKSAHVEPTREFGFLSFFAVGGLAFVVVGHGYRNRAEVSYDGHLNESLLKIWPDPITPVAWPPRYMLDRDLIDLLTVDPDGITIRIWPRQRKREAS